MDPHPALREAPSRDAVTGALIAAALAFATAAVLAALAGDELARRSIGGRWFDSDGWRAFDDMVVFSSNHFRNVVRPWFSLLAIPPVKGLELLGLSAIGAVRIFQASCLAGSSALLFLTLHWLGVARWSPLGLVALGCVSAGALF